VNPSRTAFTSVPTLAAIGLALVMAATAALAQPGMGQQTKTFKIGGPDELWDVTMKMEMPGMPMAMPAQTHQMCLKRDRKGEDAIPRQDNCKVTDVRTVGNKVSFAMECTGRDAMTGRGEITSTPTAYDGRMQMKSTRRGEEMEMTQTFSGRKVGACTDQSQQIVASAQATGAAEIAKVCLEMTEKLYYQAFFDKGAVCESRRKTFCDSVGGLARDMREPAAFKTVVAKSSLDAVQGSFRGCNANYAETAKAACSKATSTRDWAFVGNGACDDDVRAAGPTYCKGRDYYLVDRSLTSLCNRYARLTRGAGAVAGGDDTSAPPGSSTAGRTGTALPPTPTPAAQPAPQPKADPVQQGVDTLRKLLPF
jgi:hypothetical protein